MLQLPNVYVDSMYFKLQGHIEDGKKMCLGVLTALLCVLTEWMGLFIPYLKPAKT